MCLKLTLNSWQWHSRLSLVTCLKEQLQVWMNNDCSTALSSVNLSSRTGGFMSVGLLHTLTSLRTHTHTHIYRSWPRWTHSLPHYLHRDTDYSLHCYSICMSYYLLFTQGRLACIHFNHSMWFLLMCSKQTDIGESEGQTETEWNPDHETKSSDSL